jgi:protein-tyrosine kinase
MSRLDEALQRAGSKYSGAALDKNRAAFQTGPEGYRPESTSSGRRPAAVEPPPPPVAFQPRERSARAEAEAVQAIHERDEKLVTRGADHASTEQYSRLAAVLHEAQMEQGIRTLMVTSALPREGKTLTIANLALTLSGLYGRRVLLIDADLRRPSVHELFKLPNRTGLGAVLRSEQGPLPLIDVTTHLSVLVAGPPHARPMAALATNRMKTVIDAAEAEFDWVLVDTPPVGLLPDANLIARWVDGVLLVVAARVTHYKTVQDALALLGPERVLGTVLNRAEPHGVTADYGHYYPDPSAQS